jgi:hypothetical protein
LIIALALALAACTPAVPAAPTSVVILPALESQPQDPAAATPIYPPPEGAAQPAGGEYPAPSGAQPVDDAYPGPAGVPAVENRSRVTAVLLEQAPDESSPGWVRLHVRIQTSEVVDGLPNFTADKVDQEVDLFAAENSLPALESGATFTALVTFLGDEQGGRFVVQEVSQ